MSDTLGDFNRSCCSSTLNVDISDDSSTEETSTRLHDSRTNAQLSSTAPPRPKLRRKAPISDTLNESTAVQRLVEYFCVVSSQPRWKLKDDIKASGGSETQQPDVDVNNSGRNLLCIWNDSNTATQVESRQPDGSASPLQQPYPDSGNIHMPEQLEQLHTFKPVVTARYPLEDHKDNPLNPMILHFCYPTGDVIVPVEQYEMPRVHHFVLTLGCGRKMYATCLTVLEELMGEHAGEVRSVVTEDSGDGSIELVSVTSYKESKITPPRRVLYVPKILCLLSTWPYLTAFREYLSQLYRLASTTNVMDAPIERYILNICCEIPAPPPGAYEIQLPILDSTIRFWAPPAKLPIAYVALPFNILFECLDLDNLLTVWTALILERKILLLSSQYSILTVCSEIVCSLIFPLRWSHLYVPLLPRMLCPMLDAPVPYLCGIVRENWLYAQQYVSDETIVVDLDRNSVQFAANVPRFPPMPFRKWSKLQVALTETVGDVFWRAHGLEKEYAAMMQKKPHKRSLQHLRQQTGNVTQWTEKLSAMDHAFNLAYTPESPNLQKRAHNNDSMDQQSRWDKAQEAFLRFFVALLRDYRKYLEVPEPSPISLRKPSFDRAAFIAECRVDNIPFLSDMCSTQQFDDFLTRRMYSPGEPDLVFFDQNIDAKLNRSKLKIKKVDTPFLHSAKAHKQLTKLQAVSPSVERVENHGDKPYIYKFLPEKFDPSLFCTPRPIPKMISAEFDRQAILVSKLRARIGDEEVFDENCDDLLEFYGGDYDPSPEVAAFTVFLFVYSSLVGQDWQKYSQKRRDEDAHIDAEVTESMQACSLGEQRDGAIDVCGCGVETQIRDPEEDANMTTLDCCGTVACPSAFSYVKMGAEDAYNAYFRQPVEQAVKDFSLAFTAEDEILPKTDVGLAEYEEAREVAAAQLEVAFETLATMALRGLSVDSDAYLSLMEACGRCGDTKRALKLIELMKKDGFVADNDVLSCFIAAFAHEDVHRETPALQVETTGTDTVQVDAYTRFLENSFRVKSLNDGTASSIATTVLLPPRESHADDSSSSDWSSSKSSNGSTGGLVDWINIHHYPFERKMKKKRKRKRKKMKAGGKESRKNPVTDFLARHLSLGESLLDIVYPDLKIDSSGDTCPHCSNRLTEDDVVLGWKPCAFQDYTTKCPKCQHRFVPRLVVTCTAPGFPGSQGPETPLYCEFLSPWVLRKEFQHFIKGVRGIDRVLNPEWRNGTDIRATLFWNLMATCRRYKLPFSFLLQGSFQNRLILPRRPDEVDEE